MKTLKSDETPKTNDLFRDNENSDKGRSDSVTPAVTLKGSVFTLPVLKLSSFDMAGITDGLATHLNNALDFFRHAPVVVDLSDTHEVANNEEFSVLIDVLKGFELICVAVQNGTPSQQEAAIAAGLAVLSGQLKVHPKHPQPSTQTTTAQTEKTEQQDSERNQQSPEIKTDVVSGETAKVIKHPIRSGQRVYARGGDLILLAAVNAGAEIMADGNIHIYAPLRGRALAGVSGDSSARIFCHSLEAELVAVAGSYRVFEDNIPEEIHKQSVQIYLDGEQLKIVTIDS